MVVSPHGHGDGSLIGLALSATCGFRVFVPLLAVCIATRAEKTEGETYVQLAENFSWLASDPAFVVFLVAAIFEIAGYYLPIIDNFLDTLATPAAVVAGTLITAAFLVDMEPWLQWVLGVVAGGGMAGAVQATTVVARAASTVTTGGLGNPVVATVETGYSFFGIAARGGDRAPRAGCLVAVWFLRGCLSGFAAEDAPPR